MRITARIWEFLRVVICLNAQVAKNSTKSRKIVLFLRVQNIRLSQLDLRVAPPGLGGTALLSGSGVGLFSGLREGCRRASTPRWATVAGRTAAL